MRALYELIAANVRDPASTLGDLDAQLAACKRGMTRIEELAAAHGLAGALGMEALLDRPPAAPRPLPRLAGARGRGRGLPRRRGLRGHAAGACARAPLGRGRHARGRPLRLLAAGRLGDERADRERARRRLLRGARVPGPDVPQNAGLTSRVRVVAPEGSAVQPRFPAALSARHLAVQRLTDVLIEALCELLPDRSVAASHVSFPALVFQSVDPRTAG